VARANAEELNDEISTIAHKLRDLLDPDALFLLVRTNEGIRLVARSVTDNNRCLEDCRALWRRRARARRGGADPRQ
jgi:hypothetical protein